MNYLELRSKLLHWKITHPLLENEITKKYGDIQSWFRQYRSTDQSVNKEEEVNWFQTAKKIFRMEITHNKVDIQIWDKTLAVVNKSYRIVDIELGNKVLTETSLLLPGNEILIIPGPTDKEFIEQYESFVGILEMGVPESKGFVR